MSNDARTLVPPMAWNAWGDPAAAKPLSDGIRALLEQALGVTVSEIPAPSIAEVQVRPSGLADVHRDALAEFVGADYIRTDDQGRLLYAGGKSTLDLLRRKQTHQDAPDAVLLPGSEDEIATVLRYCSQHGIAVVPFGGGTSVVGGLDPIRGDFAAVISLDLRRLDALHSLDETSMQAELGAGVTGPDAERLLGEHGFSLGHFPQSFRFATIGGYAATRSSGQDSAGYGRFNDMIRGLTVVTPVGVLDLGRAPGDRGRPRPARAVLRIRGRLRRHHPGSPAGASGPGNRALRGVVVPGLRHRRGRAARRHPDRHRPHRAAVVR